MKKKPCKCKAYPFPHRELGGKCSEESISDYLSASFEPDYSAAYDDMIYDRRYGVGRPAFSGYWNYSPENFGGSRH